MIIHKVCICHTKTATAELSVKYFITKCRAADPHYYEAQKAADKLYTYLNTLT